MPKATTPRVLSKLVLLLAPSLGLLALVAVMTRPADADAGDPPAMLDAAAVAAPVVAPVDAPTPSAPAPATDQVADPALTVLVTSPAAATTPAVEPLPTSFEPSAECASALAAVEGAGLALPEGTAFLCPGNTQQREGDRQHSGVACWGHRILCPGGSYIAVNPDATAVGSHHLQYVVAHEICHIRAYLGGLLGGTEAAADECAARAGFPRP